MNCRAAKDLLPLHSGHDLDFSEARDLEMHLAACPACTADLAAYRASRNALLSARDDPAAASGIWEGLAPRLDAVDATLSLQRPWYRKPAGLLRVAAALLVIASLPFVLPGPGPDSAFPGAADIVAAPVANGAASGLIPVPDEDLLEFLRKSTALPLRNGTGLVPTSTVPAGNTPYPRF